jgi:hypothetical protein
MMYQAVARRGINRLSLALLCGRLKKRLLAGFSTTVYAEPSRCPAPFFTTGTTDLESSSPYSAYLGYHAGHSMQRSTQQQYAGVYSLLAQSTRSRPIRQTPEALYAALGVSAPCSTKIVGLATLGFTFRYNRRQRQYIITQEQFYHESVDQRSAGLDHGGGSSPPVATTLDVRRRYGTAQSHQQHRAHCAFFQASLDDVVLQEGFGCDATVVQDLWRACQEHRRLCIVHDRGDGPQEWVIDPYQILFKRRALYLDACVVAERTVKLFRINRIKRVTFSTSPIPTPIVEYSFRQRHCHSFSVFVSDQIQRTRLFARCVVHHRNVLAARSRSDLPTAALSSRSR